MKTPLFTAGGRSNLGSATLILDSENRTIADANRATDAAFIVRACNSHAALVEALEILDEVRGAIMLAEVEGDSSELAYYVERVISEARAALEAAKP